MAHIFFPARSHKAQIDSFAIDPKNLRKNRYWGVFRVDEYEFRVQI